MNFRLSPAALIAALVASPASHAHIGWSGSRNFDTLQLGVTETSSDRTVGGRFGWADGADANQGDSHRLVYFRFVITEPVSVFISVARHDTAAQSGASGVFLPAFSLYRIEGVMPASTHDSSVATVGYLVGLHGSGAGAETFTDANADGFWTVGEAFSDANGNGVWDSAGLGGSGMEGAFNALGDWRIYNDAGAHGQFRYVGHTANLGHETTVASMHPDLVAGEYFIAVGGADYLAQNLEQAPFKTYGLSVSVTAIPEPSAFAATAGLGVLGLAALRRRRA